MKKNVKLLVLALGFGLAMTGVSTQANAGFFDKVIKFAGKATYCCTDGNCVRDKTCKAGKACGADGAGSCYAAKSAADASKADAAAAAAQ